MKFFFHSKGTDTHKEQFISECRRKCRIYIYVSVRNLNKKCILLSICFLELREIDRKCVNTRIVLQLLDCFTCFIADDKSNRNFLQFEAPAASLLFTKLPDGLLWMSAILLPSDTVRKSFFYYIGDYAIYIAD